jgi:hypothetical protein
MLGTSSDVRAAVAARHNLMRYASIYFGVMIAKRLRRQIKDVIG